MLEKGSFLWYRFHAEKYVAVILDTVLDGEYFLILITEKWDGQSTDSIYELPVYTVAWFSKRDLLHESRLHFLFSTEISCGFNGYAGGMITERKIAISNCGQIDTWKHKQRSLVTNRKVKDMLDNHSFNRVIER